MKKSNVLWLCILLAIGACSKKVQHEQTVESKSKVDYRAVSHYRYLDVKIPLTFVGSSYVADKMISERSTKSPVYTTWSWLPVFAIDNTIPGVPEYEGGDGAVQDAELKIMLYKTNDLEKIIQSHEEALKHGSYVKEPPTPGFRGDFIPSACFGEVSYAKEGIKKIEQSFREKQKNDSYLTKTVAAELQVYSKDTTPYSEGSCDAKHACVREVQWILPKLPEGVIAKGLSVVIEASYTATNPEEKENVKAAKKQVNEQICEALKSMTWIPAAGTPPQWDRIPGLNDHPHTKIVTENNK